MIAATPGRRRRPLAWRSLLATLAVLVLALGVCAPAATARAQTTDAEPLLQVVLTDAAVSGASPTDTLRLSGTITNAGSNPLTGAQVRLWRSTLMLRTHLALDEARRTDPPGGRILASPTAVLSGSVPGVVAPGETVPFQVGASLGDLGFTTPATYWVGVQVSAQTPRPVEAAARTWFTLPGADATPVASVVELSSTPRQVKPNLFADDTLVDDLAGRLGTLLDAAAQPGVSRVVDPALVAELTDMADGYRVVDGDGSRPGAGADAARAWLARLQALPAASGHATLFARPDLTGAHELGGADLVGYVAQASDPRPPGTVVTLDRVTPAALAEVARLDAPVLASGTGLAVPWARVGTARVLNAVGPDTRVEATSLPDTPLNRALTLQAYARVDGGQVRLLRTAADVAADRAALPAWASRRLLGDVLAGPPADDRTIADLPGVSVMRPGDGPLLHRLGDAVAAYGSAAPDSGVGVLADAQVARAASQGWAGHDTERDAWLAVVGDRIGPQALDEGITLSALPRFTMTAATNEFPVTVTNALPDDVVLRVVGTSDTPQRIRLEASAPVTVRAGSSTGVMLTAVATGNGVAEAEVHAETTDARRLTPDAAVVVEATNLGAVGWVIVIVSGIVLVVSTALRIRQVRARNAGGGHGR